MSIKFHCSYCGKKIEAPDNAGGKLGKCPGCHNRLYVPKSDPDEELKLAPIDKDDIAKQKQLMAEMRKIEQNIMNETDTPNEPARPAAMPTSGIDSEQLMANIITYLRQMAGGELDEAERIANSITPYSNKAIKLLDEIALSEVPEPELADIPQQVLSGLIKNLRSRIS